MRDDESWFALLNAHDDDNGTQPEDHEEKEGAIWFEKEEVSVSYLEIEDEQVAVEDAHYKELHVGCRLIPILRILHNLRHPNTSIYQECPDSGYEEAVKKHNIEESHKIYPQLYFGTPRQLIFDTIKFVHGDEAHVQG